MNSKLPIIAIALLTTGFLAAFGVLALTSQADSPVSDPDLNRPSVDVGSSNWILPPQNVQELVDRASIVFVGKVNGPPILTKEGAFDETGSPIEGNQLSFARYQLEVIEFLAGDRKGPEAPVLRLFAPGGEPEIDFTKTYLFALSENPDGSYGTSAGYGMIDISSEIPKDSYGRAAEYVDTLSNGSTELLLQRASTAALKYKRIPVSEWTNRGQLQTDR